MVPLSESLMGGGIVLKDHASLVQDVLKHILPTQQQSLGK